MAYPASFAISLCVLGVLGFSTLAQVSVDDGSYTVCQKFKGSFTPHRIARDETLRGLPGKRGEKGDRGSLGNVNESPIVQNLARKLDAVNTCEGLYVAGICYYFLEEKMNYETATAACQRDGGHLVAIKTRQLYGRLFRYVYDGFVSLQSQTVIQFWLDGAYENGAVTLSSGETMPFLLWYPGYPKSGTTRKYIAFEQKKSAIGNQNMFNIYGHHTAYPLCQK